MDFATIQHKKGWGVLATFHPRIPTLPNQPLSPSSFILKGSWIVVAAAAVAVAAAAAAVDVVVGKTLLLLLLQRERHSARRHILSSKRGGRRFPQPPTGEERWPWPCGAAKERVLIP